MRCGRDTPDEAVKKSLNKLIKRTASICDYLRAADPIQQWQLIRFECPCCASSRFLSMRKDPYMTRCLRCKANVLNLSLIPSIRSHMTQHAVSTAWEMSTYGATLSFLESNVPDVIKSEFFAGRKSGEYIRGVLNQNVTATSFKSDSLDMITSNQVFEHVENDIAGFAECYRILRSGGG